MTVYENMSGYLSPLKVGLCLAFYELWETTSHSQNPTITRNVDNLYSVVKDCILFHSNLNRLFVALLNFSHIRWRNHYWWRAFNSICLFVWGYCPIREFFYQMEKSHSPVRALNFEQYSALMAIGVGISYCDTGFLFIMVISDNPWHSHLLLSVKQWVCHYLF